MKVIRAAVLGFCGGVRRAVEMALRSSAEARSPQAHVYMLGPLIHNSRVLETLKKRGIGILEGEILKQPPINSTVIIRTHGISPSVEEELRQQGLRLLDATCPHVKANQNKARLFAEKGYLIFLAGEKNHAEISAIQGCVEAAFEKRPGICEIRQNRIAVVCSPEEAGRAAAELRRSDGVAPLPGAVLIGQTTISAEEYSKIGAAIKDYFPQLEILDTICGATADRQEALRELCPEVDALFIIGDRESANTRRLLSLALAEGKPAWLVEKPEDLPPEIRTYKTVGLSAGASTPDDLIDEIETVLNTIKP